MKTDYLGLNIEEESEFSVEPKPLVDWQTNITDNFKLIDNEFKEQSITKYNLKITSDITAGTKVTIPCYYKVGSSVLDVYLNGERLLLSSDDSGTDGHYLEVGDTGATSNIIKTTTDWSLASGDYLEFVVKGVYE